MLLRKREVKRGQTRGQSWGLCTLRNNAAETHQKGAEEDEGDKVYVCHIGAACLVSIILEGVGVTGAALDAGQHDALPCLPRGTPAHTLTVRECHSPQGSPSPNPAQTTLSRAD